MHRLPSIDRDLYARASAERAAAVRDAFAAIARLVARLAAPSRAHRTA